MLQGNDLDHTEIYHKRNDNTGKGGTGDSYIRRDSARKYNTEYSYIRKDSTGKCSAGYSNIRKDSTGKSNTGYSNSKGKCITGRNNIREYITDREILIEDASAEPREQRKDLSKSVLDCGITSCEASLTVEAAFILPLFLFAFLALLYFIQIFTLQELIQAGITKMGLAAAKTAYLYEDFAGIEDSLNFDATIFGNEIEIKLGDFAKSLTDQTILKVYAQRYLDVDRINHSCVRDGFDGISYYSSSILEEEDIIDIVVRYQVALPIRLFAFEDMHMMQRVRVRAWTGRELAPTYSTQEEEESKERMVYITETGRVYHLSASCSHIDLSVTAVQGIPTTQRNESGGKYYPCEQCCKGQQDPYDIFYITEDGTRYHSLRKCSKIKRNVKVVPISQVKNRPACKRCGK